MSRQTVGDVQSNAQWFHLPIGFRSHQRRSPPFHPPRTLGCRKHAICNSIFDHGINIARTSVTSSIDNCNGGYPYPRSTCSYCVGSVNEISGGIYSKGGGPSDDGDVLVDR